MPKRVFNHYSSEASSIRDWNADDLEAANLIVNLAIDFGEAIARTVNEAVLPNALSDDSITKIWEKLGKRIVDVMDEHR